MQNILRLVCAILLLGVIMFWTSPLRAASPEADFWVWFQKNEATLYDFEKDQEKIFDLLGNALGKVHKDLTFEFGPKMADGKREFVISAGGIKTAFPNVEALFAAAPEMKRWTVIKFRPRRKDELDVEINGVAVKAKEMKFMLFKDADPAKIGILLFVPGFQKDKEDKNIKQIGYLFLDHVLGEYDVEMKVGAIDYEEQKSEYFKRAKPLAQLAEEFDAHFQAKKK